jgi:hypothetical protein
MAIRYEKTPPDERIPAAECKRKSMARQVSTNDSSGILALTMNGASCSSTSSLRFIIQQSLSMTLGCTHPQSQKAMDPNTASSKLRVMTLVVLRLGTAPAPSIA